MGRLVRKPRSQVVDQPVDTLDGLLLSNIAEMPVAGPVAGDSYLERMVKYVPGEVIGFSMLINAILAQAATNGGPGAAMAGCPVTAIAA